MPVNNQKEMERILENIRMEGRIPRLLLHSCCAPCSSYCLELLSEYFLITVFYYNPNISSRAEYEKRVREQQRLIRELPSVHPIAFLEGAYEPERFLALSEGLEEAPEGGERCSRCFALRLFETALAAGELGFEYFATTLSISPLKNAQRLNEIGKRAAMESGASWLPSDFKKKNGYKRSLELSEQYGLYRQNYCGCIFSGKERSKGEALPFKEKDAGSEQNEDNCQI